MQVQEPVINLNTSTCHY